MTNKKCSGKRCPLDSTAYNEDCTAIDHCKWFTPKIVTNRQWLESLSDEELARFFLKIESLNGKGFICPCPYGGGRYSCMPDDCICGYMDWLKAEHKESEQ